MTEKKEVKSKIDQVKELATLEHSDIQFITGGNVEGSTAQNEFGVATNEGLFFYHYKNEKLIPIMQTLWQDVNEIRVDYLAMRTNLTLDGQNYRLTNEGKKIFNLAAQKSDAKIENVDRKWHQKILGFRSGTNWKKITAVITYLLLFGFFGSFFFGEEEAQVVTNEEKPAKVAAQEATDTNEEKELEEDTAENQVPVPNFEILEEDLNSVGIYRITLATDSTDENEIESLIRHTVTLANAKETEVNSINVAVRQTNVDALNIATGRIALTSKGLAQTGFTEVPEVKINLILDNIVDTSKIVGSESSYTADDVVEAFQNEGLSLVDPRDNTDKQCGEGNMPCSQLITTEDVSIFLWPTEEEAASIGGKYHDHSNGFFTLRFNEPLSPEEEYKRVINELVAN